MKLAGVTRRGSAVRYVAVAAAAFFLGSASIVAAAPALGPIFRLQDGTTPNLASVDANGSLAVRVTGGTINTSVNNTDFPDAGAHSRLDTANNSLTTLDGDLDAANSTLTGIESQTDNLQFDASSNLRVSVANQPATAPDPDSVRVPFQKSTLLTVADGASTLAAGQFTVPAGQRLVIEYVSVHERNPGDRLVDAMIRTKAGTNPGIFHAINFDDNGDWYFAGADQVRMYADAGQNVSFQVAFAGTSGDRNVSIEITGYLVPLP
jgi:hypothetical protein